MTPLFTYPAHQAGNSDVKSSLSPFKKGCGWAGRDAWEAKLAGEADAMRERAPLAAQGEDGDRAGKRRSSTEDYPIMRRD